MGLDATLALLLLVGSTARALDGAFVVPALFGLGLESVAGLAGGAAARVSLAGLLVVAGVLRRLVGPSAIQRNAEALNGVSVMILFIFVSAMMAGFIDQFLADPGAVCVGRP